MRDRIEKRRAELAAEMDKGQRIINDLQARLARAHEEMARLDGAVQVLGELLAGVPADMPAETGEPEPAAARGTEMVGCRAGMSVDELRLRLEGIIEDKIAEALAPAGPYLEVRREGSRKYDRVPLPTEPGAALRIGADPGSGLVLEGLAPMHATVERNDYVEGRYRVCEVKGGGGTVYADDELVHTDAGDGAAWLREGSIVKLEYATTYTLTLRGSTNGGL